ncbi:fungal-specific transcription factor domain-containing protein [Xylogone sp. PMI_703]|nr:fungal-specific transcription factor domain-containing protein [Xylogone sp. PMI_703]
MESRGSNRARKRSSKAFKCPLCERVYSRAEHLYRHQLNHNPRQIYRCNMRNCDRTFVREDLLIRHKDRHSNSDKEYQRQLENNFRMNYQPATDMSPPRPQHLTAPAHPPPTTDIEALASITSGPFHTTDQDIQIDLPTPIVSPVLEGNYNSGSSVHRVNTTPQSVSTLLDQNISFRYNTENQPMSVNSDYPDQNVDGSLYDTCGLWQDELALSGSMPDFGGQGYNRSPFTMSDDFIKFLFEGNIPSSSSTMPPVALNPEVTSSGHSPITNMQYQYQPKRNANEINDRNFSERPFLDFELLEQDHSLMMLSESKNEEICDLIKNGFGEVNHSISTGAQPTISRDQHNLSNLMNRGMMQKYINNFWRNFHPQLPILHKPTFSPNSAPNLLLIAIIMVGASCSNKGGNPDITQASIDIGNMLARHLRWEIFRDAHFHPASLWVFQALLLLEIYEKMFSTRDLHERAHIHHATTITLLRRDIALTERSILDSPSRYQEKSAYSKSGLESPPNDSWEHWITREATRRVAFAAFMIDATHAAMFGHSTIMVTHEIRCMLPCDDALWFATSATEVARIKSALHANHIKPISFLEGLQRILNGQEVPTNDFGKNILMCGLLSVSWYMNQRDLQIKSLGIDPEAPSSGRKWGKSIARAFDIWKQSYKKEAVSTSHDSLGYKLDKDLVLESRIALYHLAQISMYADIVECQIFAGAKRVLGRAISKLDFGSARRRIQDIWAPTTDARAAVFYSIRYLCTVLLPKGSPREVYPPGHDFVPDYAARKSIIPSRCWVLYSAALVVWCFSYAVDGPMTALAPSGTSLKSHINDMNAFLLRVDRIVSPDELIHHRLNGCGGLLKVIRYILLQAEWELLREAAELLTNCIELIEKSSGV